MASKPVDRAVSNHIIAYQCMLHLNQFMEQVMDVTVAKFGDNLKQVSEKLSVSTLETEEGRIKVVQILEEAYDVFYSFREKQKYQSHIMVRYMEIIGEKWMSAFLDELLYTANNKDFFIDQCKMLLSPYYQKTWSSSASKIISFIDTAYSLATTPNLPQKPNNR